MNSKQKIEIVELFSFEKAIYDKIRSELCSDEKLSTSFLVSYSIDYDAKVFLVDCRHYAKDSDGNYVGDENFTFEFPLWDLDRLPSFHRLSFMDYGIVPDSYTITKKDFPAEIGLENLDESESDNYYCHPDDEFLETELNSILESLSFQNWVLNKKNYTWALHNFLECNVLNQQVNYMI